jgi:hypothetical protein
MRRTVFGLAAAAALVLAACGGDDDDSSSADDSGGSETTEAAGGGGGSGGGSQFCDDFAELTQQGPAAGSDPASVIEAMRALEPPQEIAEDFELTIEGAELQQQMTAGGGGEPDPELLAQFEERQADYEAANASIQEYISTECAMGSPPPSEPES